MIRTIMLFLAVLCLACPVQAGWEITEQDPDGFSSQVIRIQDSKIRRENRGGPGFTVLDVKEETLLLVNPKAKTYWKGPIKELHKKITTFFRESKEKFEKQIAALPEEQRQSARESAFHYMGPRAMDPAIPLPEVRVKKTGKQEKIVGIPSQAFDVNIGGRLEWRIWMSKKNFFGKDLDLKKYYRVKRQYGESLNFMQQQGNFPPEVLELFQNGWKMKIEIFPEYQMEEPQVQQVVKAQEKNLDASLFSVPQDFTAHTLDQSLGF